MDNMFAANKDDLDRALELSQNEAREILAKVNEAKLRLANTEFIGEQASDLADELNVKMDGFVEATYLNIESLLRLIVDSMNVVVTKLGGGPWANAPVARGDVARAAAMEDSAGKNYRIDTAQMNQFAGEVDDRFEEIVTSYNKIRSAIVDDTPGWMGPEKNSAVGQVNAAIDEILGSPGGEGNGVRGVGASLSG